MKTRMSYNREKYERLLEKFKNPVVYEEYRARKLKAQRKYAEDPEFRKRRALSTADWRFRKTRGLPTRERVSRKPHETNFEFTIVPEVSVSFS